MENGVLADEIERWVGKAIMVDQGELRSIDPTDLRNNIIEHCWPALLGMSRSIVRVVRCFISGMASNAIRSETIEKFHVCWPANATNVGEGLVYWRGPD